MPRSTGVKDKVDEAAVGLFAARGVDGVSIAEIAAAAGVSQGALYRHYASKEELAWMLFSTAYLRTASELDDIRSRHRDFAGQVTAMVTHFCRLYDADASLFRFMLISQHDLLPRLTREQRTAVDAVADAVADTVAAAVQAGEIAAVDSAAAAAVIIGIVLQTAIFHIYGKLSGGLTKRAPALACAAIAAVTALAEPPR
jgi:AcrR family transcriptional regulator